jgi:hypothetical protein
MIKSALIELRIGTGAFGPRAGAGQRTWSPFRAQGPFYLFNKHDELSYSGGYDNGRCPRRRVLYITAHTYAFMTRQEERQDRTMIEQSSTLTKSVFQKGQSPWGEATAVSCLVDAVMPEDDTRV